MFIVKKKIAGKEYYYLRESRRVDGKVKAITLGYLGKTRKEAELKLKEFKNGKMQEGNMVKTETKEDIAKKPELIERQSSRLRESDNFSLKKEKQKPNIKMKPTNNPYVSKANKELTIDELASFCKRKGLIFKSSEIYGGLAGFWDYGQLGAELVNNIRREWWKFFVQEKENMVGIEASIISHPRTWKASGHLASFSDVSVRCEKCKKYNKVDKAELEKAGCSFCGGKLDKSSARDLNLMFQTKIGPVEEESLQAYLRPETAQGMFLDFKQVQETSRKQLPFGIAQIGKCFRNEIAPRDFLFRSREFQIAELEFFIHPEENKCELLDDYHKNVKLKLLDKETQLEGGEELKETTIGKMLQEKRLEEWHAYWLAEQIFFFNKLGLNKIKVREHMKSELSHYSSATFDLDYEYPFGSKELGGNANRGTYDLTSHMKESGEKLDLFDEKSKKRVVPKVIEPTFGIERLFLALLCQAYTFDEKRQNVVLKLPAFLAPVKAAIFPIVKVDEKIVKMAREVYNELKRERNVSYDGSGSLGRRYSRADETGVPVTITLDEQSLKDKTATLRDRDTTEQIRVPISKIKEVMNKVIQGENLLKLGEVVKTRVK